MSGLAEEIKCTEVREAIAKSKSDKASGPSGVVSEMLKAAGEPGVQWVTSIFNSVIREGKILAVWRKSWLVNVYKGKGDALACGSYSGLKLLDQVMKILERVLEKRIRERVTLDEMQFGFRPGRGTIDAILIVRQMQEKILAKKKELWMALWIWRRLLIRVPREIVWWALRVVGVDEWIAKAVQAMYDGATTAVRLRDGESKEFGVKVGSTRAPCFESTLYLPLFLGSTI